MVDARDPIVAFRSRFHLELALSVGGASHRHGDAREGDHSRADEDRLPGFLWKSGQLSEKKRFRSSRATAITRSRTESAVDGFTFGAEPLLASLRSLQAKKGGPLTVGVVGFPKVGREQLIAHLCEASPLFQSDARNSAELNSVGQEGV